jgi:2-phospho-L-lactate guanylyltransferase
MPNSAPIWALVPVKPLQLAKSRLAGVLSGDERQALASFMLQRVLEAVRRSDVFDGVLVVSSDQAVCRVALEFGATSIPDQRDTGTNAAVMQGLDFLSGRPASALVLHADLPDIATEEHNRGTNMLGIAAGRPVEPQFGEESFIRHVAAARKLGFEPVVLRRHGISSDVDSPGDLDSPTVSDFLRKLRSSRGARRRSSGQKFMSVGQA